MVQQTLWGRVRAGSKTGFDKAWKTVDKLGAPVNKLSNKLGSEAFWPTTLDKESDKAARILKSFCKDGFYAEDEFPSEDGPKQKQKVIKKIPASIIKNAKGLAIFTTMRTGLWVSGAGGSGILIAKKDDGSWSPPSGILLHTAGLGFMVGIDVYDCVIVINTKEALDAFTRIRCTLGGEVSVAAGPVGAGGVLETELHKRQAPIFTYMKSRGFYAGVQIDGSIIIERTDENERFYGHKIPVKDILAGGVRHPPYEIRRLLETLKAAQGDSDVDQTYIPTEAPPSDFEVDDGHVFGVPDKEDPDPYGVLALEKEGMSIKEAGTQKRASWEAFSFNPAPSSPVHSVYARNSSDRPRSVSRRSSWRTSAFGNEPKTPSSLRNSMEQPSTPVLMTDTSTQTEFPPDPPSPSRNSMRSAISRRSSKASFANSHMQEVPENEVLDTSPTRNATETMHVNGYTTPPRTPPAVQEHEKTEHDEDTSDDEDDVHIEEPVVHSVQAVQPVSPQAISKLRIVNVPKRIPPKLPPRNPNRSGPVVVDASPDDRFCETPEEWDTESKHDSGRVSSPMHDDATHPIKAAMTDIHLDDNEHEEQSTPNSDSRKTAEEAQQRDSMENARIPGGFD